MKTEYADETRLKNRIKKLSKAHRSEVVQTFLNLEKALVFWENSNVESLRTSGLVRAESDGVVALDETGCRTNPRYPVRLYMYPVENEDGKTCILLTIGDKRTQQEDNNWCREQLKKQKGD